MSTLEVDPAWRVRQHESEVNMDDVALWVNHDVPIVSILDIEHIAQQRIPCQTFSKVLLSFLEILEEVLSIEGVKIPLSFLVDWEEMFKRVDWDGLW